jgi:aryl-alcohol dehydrogenase-like predicted oxidoreductase
MGSNQDNSISRKEFLKKSAAGLAGFSLINTLPPRLFGSSEEKIKTGSEYRILGKTGLKVTTVGYGASRTMDQALVKRALDKGINFLDTGRTYFGGQNEVMVGKVIKERRKDIIVQSKMRVSIKEKGEKLQSKKVKKKIQTMMDSSLNKSLKALQTDYIDIMLIHAANSVDIINHEVVIDFFRNAKKKGQIRAYGFSSHTNQVELLKAANKNKSYEVIMVPYNHKGSYIHSNSGKYKEWNQPALEVELEKAEKNNIGIVAMKTCSGGPYSSDKDEPSYKNALDWILNHSFIGTMAVAMGNIDELNENIQVMLKS